MAQSVAVRNRAEERASFSEVFYTHRNVLIIWGLLLLIVLIATALQPEFATPRNIKNILVQSTALGVISVGQTFVILAAGIDISVGSVASLVVVEMSILADKDPAGVLPGILVGLAIGVLAGLANGLGITRLKVNPFMMTLGSMSICQGIALQLRPQPGGLIPDNFSWLADSEWFNVPVAVYFFALVALVGFWILHSTKFGRHVYAVGGSEETTRLSGLPTDRIKVGTYVVCSFAAALAGVFLSSRIRSGDALIGTSFGLDSITAVVLGGTNLFGGRGSLLGTIAGVFIVASLSNIMNLVGVSTYYQYILKGAILIVAVSFYYVRRKKA
ncbi:MAG: ABC transporter permease [Chloroflexi bacterium]|nr:ABC transporter permease [Chloroflexota bacterium]